MSIEALKQRLSDVPGIQDLTMQTLVGRNVYGFNGLIAAVDPQATDDEIETAIRNAAQIASFGRPNQTPLPTVNLVTETKPMTAPAPGSFAASIKAMMDEARAGVEKAKTEGLAQVRTAVSKLGDAAVTTTKVANNMAQAAEDEAASVLSELGQITNDL